MNARPAGYAALAVAIIATAAVAREAPTDQPQPNQPIFNGQAGRPLPQTVRQTVGQAGGTLRLGPHDLRIEKDALTENIEFEFTELAGQHVQLRIRSTDGRHVTFARPARLTVNLRPRCPSLRPQGLAIWRIAEDGGMSRLDTSVPTMSARLRAYLDSNSLYIIAD